MMPSTSTHLSLSLFALVLSTLTLSTLTLSTGVASAQPNSAQPSSAQPANPETATSSSVVLRRVEREYPCIEGQQRRLTDTLRMLQEARIQLMRTDAGEAAQTDAARTIEALELRIPEIAQQLQRCIGNAHTSTNTATSNSPTTSNAPTPQTSQTSSQQQPTRRIEVDIARSGAPRILSGSARSNAPVMDGPRHLSENVRIRSGHKVRGPANTNLQAIREAIERVGPRLDACYQSFVETRALQRGELRLDFRVLPDGQVTNIAMTILSLHDKTLQRCTAQAVGRLRIPKDTTNTHTSSAGTYHYVFEFGPPPVASAPPALEYP